MADVSPNDYILESVAAMIKSQKRFIKLVDREQQIKFSLDGMFMHKNLMWFSTSVANSSMINYQIDYLKVFIRDRVRSKRTIVQEKEVLPVFTMMDENVSSDSTSRMIMAFEPFIVPVNKMLVIQMAEKWRKILGVKGGE